MFYRFTLIISSILICTTFSNAERFEVPQELDELLTLKPIDEHLLEDNLYIGWMGMRYPEDNWQTKYKDFLQKNDQFFDDQLLMGNTVVQYVDDPTKRNLNKVWDKALKPSPELDMQDEIILLNDEMVLPKKNYTFKQQPYSSDNPHISNHLFFVCGDYIHQNCIDEMQERQDYIENTVADNKILLERFRILTKESKVNIALYFNDTNVSTEMVPKAALSRIYQLNLADSIAQLLNGKMDEGIDNLVLARRWLDINYDFNSRPTIFQFVMNILYAQYLDQTMDAILDKGLLENYLDDSRVKFVFRPYPKDIGKAVNTTLLWEIERNFKSNAYPYLKVYTKESKLHLSDEDEFIALSFFRSKGLFLPSKLFQRHQQLIKNKKPLSKKMEELRGLGSLNKSILESSVDTSWLVIQIMLDNVAESEVYDEWYNKFFFELNATPKTVLNYLNYKYPSIEYYLNYFESIQTIRKHQDEYLSVARLNELLEPKSTPLYFKMIKRFPHYDSFEQYWNRLYEQQNYHQLVYLKYLVVKNKISTENLAEFLDSMGEIAKDTITHERYKFNYLTMMLSTPLPKNKKYLPVNIRDAYMDDHSIENFEVQLPKY